MNMLADVCVQEKKKTFKLSTLETKNDLKRNSSPCRQLSQPMI